jgi:hypothetical protein
MQKHRLIDYTISIDPPGDFIANFKYNRFSELFNLDYVAVSPYQSLTVLYQEDEGLLIVFSILTIECP